MSSLILNMVCFRRLSCSTVMFDKQKKFNKTDRNLMAKRVTRMRVYKLCNSRFILYLFSEYPQHYGVTGCVIIVCYRFVSPAETFYQPNSTAPVEMVRPTNHTMKQLPTIMPIIGTPTMNSPENS